MSDDGKADILYSRILEAAEKHGEESGEPDHEVGDLQDALLATITLVSDALGPAGIQWLETSPEIQQILRGPDWEPGDEDE